MSNTPLSREALQVAKTLQLLARSQLGFEGRVLEDKLKDRALQIAVCGGDVVKPFDEEAKAARKAAGINGQSLDLGRRVQLVTAGLDAYARLAANGIFPGQGGFTVSSDGATTTPGRSSASSPIPEVGGNVLKRIFATRPTGMTAAEEDFLVRAAEEAGNTFPPGHLVDETGQVVNPGTTIPSPVKQTKGIRYTPVIPKDYEVKVTSHEAVMANSKERRVPSSRLGRLASFGALAVGLGSGAVAEVTKRTLGIAQAVESSNPFLTPSNAERIVSTLCRVRGAALKLGQMLSIQDEELVPRYLLDIFERVRQSADFMPIRQVHAQLRRELGDDWRSRFAEFDDKPFAAASIGQVHSAVTLDGRHVAVKIQYPGVAEGIDSDINNLVSVMNIGGLFPKGMFLGNFIAVARRELRAECDYEREARAIGVFRRLLADDPNFYIPGVVPALSTKRVLTTEFVEGTPVDKCVDEPQAVRDYLATKFMELCLKEIFVWRFMQTDPNWSNFFLGKHPETGEPRLILLDFGASRSYAKIFADRYMHILRAAYDNDREKMLKYSKDIGFLTGYESKVMEDAHCSSITILGETLAAKKPYDFSKQDLTRRLRDLIPVMLENRLTSPPEEIYSLHRKLSGAFLLASKLRAVVSCGPLYEDIYDQYTFGEDGKDIDIDGTPI